MKYLVSILLCLLTFTSCIDEDQYTDDPQGNFESLWKIIDQHYCFFTYKKQAYGLDWDSVMLIMARAVKRGLERRSTEPWM